MTRPRLFFYCQHSLGLGHAVRSYALAAALAERFQVVLASGGEPVDGLGPPEEVELLELPPLRASSDWSLVTRQPAGLENARRRRRELLLDTLRSLRPAAVVVELFPFGRRRFADELVPLLEAAREAEPRPLIFSSVRDILVGKGPDQEAHDTITCVLANRYLDGILVHSDPGFARLEESFRPRIPLRVPVRHTGFVVPEREDAPPGDRERRVIVSAGGGLVGAPLLRAALEAAPLLPVDLRLEAVAGPFLPEEDWDALRRTADELPGVELHRFAPGLGERIRGAAASVSQCGYNTSLDLLRAGVPALVVPFADGREDEQARRAERLERQGALRVLTADRLEPATLAREIVALLDFEPRRIDLDLSGAETSAAALAELVRDAFPAEAAAR